MSDFSALILKTTVRETQRPWRPGAIIQALHGVDELFGLAATSEIMLLSGTMQLPPPLPTVAPVGAQDKEQLRLLYFLHLIISGLAAVGVLLMVGQYFGIHFILKRMPTTPVEGQVDSLQLSQFMELFGGFYRVVAVFLVFAAGLNLLSAVFLKKRKYRIFTLFVAGYDCLYLPIGTALGVFTILTLKRESVRELYEKATRPRSN